MNESQFLVFDAYNASHGMIPRQQLVVHRITY